MNAAQLVEAGEALFGAHWQTPLSRELRVDIRRMRYWANDACPVPPGVAEEIRTLLVIRARRIVDVATRLCM